VRFRLRDRKGYQSLIIPVFTKNEHKPESNSLSLAPPSIRQRFCHGGLPARVRDLIMEPSRDLSISERCSLGLGRLANDALTESERVWQPLQV
jgi:hypothetical protein